MRKYKAGQQVYGFIEGTVEGYFQEINCYEVIDSDGERIFVKPKYLKKNTLIPNKVRNYGIETKNI